MATLREKLAALLAAGIAIGNVFRPDLMKEVPDPWWDDHAAEIHQQYEALERAKRTEERRGKDDDD